MQIADALVRILRAEGVEQSFCYPFSPIMDAMARAGVKPIVTRQERVAGNMADGVSRSTNGDKLGVVTVQALAGSENAFAGIAHAHTPIRPRCCSSPAIRAPASSAPTPPSTAPATMPASPNGRRPCW